MEFRDSSSGLREWEVGDDPVAQRDVELAIVAAVVRVGCDPPAHVDIVLHEILIIDEVELLGDRLRRPTAAAGASNEIEACVDAIDVGGEIGAAECSRHDVLVA